MMKPFAWCLQCFNEENLKRRINEKGPKDAWDKLEGSPSKSPSKESTSRPALNKWMISHSYGLLSQFRGAARRVLHDPVRGFFPDATVARGSVARPCAPSMTVGGYYYSVMGPEASGTRFSTGSARDRRNTKYVSTGDRDLAELAMLSGTRREVNYFDELVSMLSVFTARVYISSNATRNAWVKEFEPLGKEYSEAGVGATQIRSIVSKAMRDLVVVPLLSLRFDEHEIADIHAMSGSWKVECGSVPEAQALLDDWFGAKGTLARRIDGARRSVRPGRHARSVDEVHAGPARYGNYKTSRKAGHTNDDLELLPPNLPCVFSISLRERGGAAGGPSDFTRFASEFRSRSGFDGVAFADADFGPMRALCGRGGCDVR
jgi:hypothetical protein